ncbi:MAG: InaA protein [Cellvibrionales bacterium]|nr:InaA protein [Cellvibrionales bacterium]
MDACVSATNDLSVPTDFNGWWNLRGESVEPANVRRDGESGVERLVLPALGMVYIKRQRNHLFRSLRYPFGLPTVMREKFATSALRKLSITTPEIVFAEARKVNGDWQAVLVTKSLDGFVDLETWYGRGGRQRIGDEQHQRLLQEMGRVLGVVHNAQWQHTCLYPKHIFLTAGDTVVLPEIALLDLEKARHCWLPKKASRRDLDQLYRHSRELWSEQEWKILLAGHAKS